MQFLSAPPPGHVFGLDAQMLASTIMQILNAVVLFALLFFILYKPVREMLKKRAERIQSQMERAEQDMNEADLLKAQYKENLSHIEEERVEILGAAHKSATQKSKGIVEEAKSEAEAAKKQARLDIMHQEEQARAALKMHVIELSSAMATKIVSHTIDREAQDRLFDEALRELEGATWPR